MNTSDFPPTIIVFLDKYRCLVKININFSLSLLITVLQSRETTQVPPEEQELLTLLEHLISPPVLVRFVFLDL